MGMAGIRIGDGDAARAADLQRDATRRAEARTELRREAPKVDDHREERAKIQAADGIAPDIAAVDCYA